MSLDIGAQWGLLLPLEFLKLHYFVAVTAIGSPSSFLTFSLILPAVLRRK